jgi:hypothetical protein
MPKFAYVWEYLVRSDKIDEFESMYGPTGDWALLFSRAAGYFRTDLLRDVSNPLRFVTIDFWTSKAERDRFRKEVASAFELLDRKGEALTEAERFVGDFDLVGEPTT